MKGVLGLLFKSTVLLLLLYSNLWAAEPQRVLFISAYHPAFPTFFQQVDGLKSVFSHQSILLDIEFMDSKRFPERETVGRFYRSLAAKLARLKPYDVIMVADDNALSFALEYQRELFPGQPIVFLGVNNVELALQQNTNPAVTGVVETVSMRETLEVMLTLHPDAQRVVALVDSLPSGQADLKTFYHYEKDFSPVAFSELSLATLSFAEFAAQLQALGEKDLVLLLSAYRDKNAKTLLFHDSLELIRANLSRPLYHLWFHGLGQGVLGGKLISHRQQGIAAGEIVLEILKGRAVENISVRQESPNRYLFDYKEMARFGIKRSSLPADSQIYNAAQSYYRQNKLAIWMVIGVFFGYTLLLFGMGLAIRRRKRVEEALSASESHYRAIVEDQTELICRNLPDFTISFANQAYCRYFNRSRDQLVGKSFLSLIPAADRPAVEGYFASLNSSNPVSSHEHSVTMPDGEVRWHHWTNRAILAESGEVVEYQGVGRDITEQKRAEEALRKSEERFHAIFDGVNDAIFLYEFETGAICDVNAKAEEMYGYSRDEMRQMTAGELSENQPPYTQAEALAWLGKAQRGETPTFEWRARHRNGDRFWVDISMRRADLLGDPTILVTVRNIENRKQAEKMEAIGVMAGGIAHDFNNLLAIILGNAEMVRHKLADGKGVEKNMERITHAALRGSELIKQILTFSRKENQQFQAVKPAKLIKESLKMLRSTIPTGVEIVRSIAAGAKDAIITADETQLQQVLFNLCTNAVHAMDEKGQLKISLATVAPGGADLPADQRLLAKTYLRLSVSDTGQGMSKPTLDKIFDPFFTTKSVGKGTGMGLAVVQGIVDNHNGFISVATHPGKGSTFHVYFPLAGDTESPAPRPEPPPLQTGTEHILLVDDEVDLANANKELLELLGYQVTVTSRSLEALQMLENSPDQFDLVITDQTMPELSGSELATRILARNSALPIILCSGYSAKITESAAKAIGIREFCLKPLDQLSLSRVVRRVLDRSGKTQTG